MPAFEFLSYDELMIIAVVGLFLVVRNWWDWFRDAFERRFAPATALPGTAPRPMARAAAALGRLRRHVVRRTGGTTRHRHGA
jgi:hypothetical protein